MSEPDAAVDTRRSPIQSIDRATELLGVIAAAGPAGIALTPLASEVGLRGSTARTLLSALVMNGLVGQVGQGRRYVLGPRLFELNRVHQLQHDLASVAAPVLRGLWERTDETVHLATLQNGRRADLSVLVSRQLLGVNPTNMGAVDDPVGALGRTAAGKVLLAGLDAVELGRLFPEEDAGALEAELALARDAGHAVNVEEEVLGVCGVAAPVLDPAGTVVGAVCIGYPSARRSPNRERELVAAVVAAAAEVSGLIGGAPGGDDA